MYLFDTDVLSNLMRASPSTDLVVRLARVPAEQQFTSSITLGELIYGAYHVPSKTQRLLDQIERVVLSNLPNLPFEELAARVYGEVRAHLERRGTPIGDAYVRIAAIALSRDLTVVTGNVRHFERVPGLRVENWLS